MEKVQGRAASLIRGPETLLCVERWKEREVELGEMAAEEEYGHCSPLFLKDRPEQVCDKQPQELNSTVGVCWLWKRGLSGGGL